VKTLCDQMKLFVSGASTIPVVTPVATATTLPPSISALQQQGVMQLLFLTVIMFYSGVIHTYVQF